MPPSSPSLSSEMNDRKGYLSKEIATTFFGYDLLFCNRFLLWQILQSMGKFNIKFVVVGGLSLGSVASFMGRKTQKETV